MVTKSMEYHRNMERGMSFHDKGRNMLRNWRSGISVLDFGSLGASSWTLPAKDASCEPIWGL
jgi:hypothetical protein